MPLILEIERDDRWVKVGELTPLSTPGTVSHNDPTGRQIYRFTCCATYSLLERSIGGVDIEHGPLIRATISVAWETVARLEDGESYDCWLMMDVSPQARHIQWTHRD